MPSRGLSSTTTSAIIHPNTQYKHQVRSIFWGGGQLRDEKWGFSLAQNKVVQAHFKLPERKHWNCLCGFRGKRVDKAITSRRLCFISIWRACLQDSAASAQPARTYPRLICECGANSSRSTAVTLAAMRSLPISSLLARLCGAVCRCRPHPPLRLLLSPATRPDRQRYAITVARGFSF